MIRLILVILCLLAISGPVGAALAEPPESLVRRQEIEVTLQPSEHLLRGASTITFAAGTQNVSLRLSPAAIIESVAVSGSPTRFLFSNGTLSLAIPSHTGREVIPVTVTYHVFFNDPLPQDAGSSEDPTYGVRGAITTQGTYLDEAGGWYPLPPSLPRTRLVRVAAPAGTEAITSGKRVKRGVIDSVSYSSWEEARPVGGLSLCAGPFTIEERHERGVDLYTYFYPANASLSSRYLDAASTYIKYYSELFGPYPFEKFAVVENFFPTGYGFPSFTLLGSSIIRLPFIIDTSFPHEIAHSWWGNAIEVDQSEGNWAEGLVTYLADYLLKERRSVAEGREFRLQILTDFATLVSVDADFPLAAFSSRVDPASRTIGYGKSAMLFHLIRTEIGDRAFFAALQEISQERRYRTATWSDFTRAFSRSSGRNLSGFMQQWLGRAGAPRVTFSNVMSRREGDGWSVSGAVVQTAPFYELPVPLQLETDGAALDKILPVTGGVTLFKFITPAQPKRLLLDPNADLFRLLDRGEIPVTVNSIKGSKQLIAVTTEDCRARDATFRRLLESLGKGATRVIREDELEAEQRRTNDLIFCGIPKQRQLLPLLPSAITVSASGFTVDKEVVQGSDGLLFLVLPVPAPSGRFAALFRPLSEMAAEQYVSKITHYGKYGSLGFVGGAIRYKSTVPPSSGRSRVDF